MEAAIKAGGWEVQLTSLPELRKDYACPEEPAVLALISAGDMSCLLIDRLK